jgi:hypothetical protein
MGDDFLAVLNMRHKTINPTNNNAVKNNVEKRILPVKTSKYPYINVPITMETFSVTSKKLKKEAVSLVTGINFE